MTREEWWKNFRLGEELQVAGAFIFNGLRRFHELQKLNQPDEIFEVLYFFSVGFERLMKVAVVLLEHDELKDQVKFEETLITHSHQDLMRRVRNRVAINLATVHNDFLAMLTEFYKTFRYDRYSLQSVGPGDKERDALLAFISKHLQVEFDHHSLFGIVNEPRFKKFIEKTAMKVSKTLYEVVRSGAQILNLYTYELRDGSKAQTVFLGCTSSKDGEVLWKELLVFFMNTRETTGYLKFLRDVEPLGFDPGLIGDYLECFRSEAAKALVIDQLEALYEEVVDKAQRLKMMDIIGSPCVSFDDEEE